MYVFTQHWCIITQPDLFSLHLIWCIAELVTTRFLNLYCTQHFSLSLPDAHSLCLACGFSLPRLQSIFILYCILELLSGGGSKQVHIEETQGQLINGLCTAVLSSPSVNSYSYVLFYLHVKQTYFNNSCGIKDNLSERTNILNIRVCCARGYFAKASFMSWSTSDHLRLRGIIVFRKIQLLM